MRRNTSLMHRLKDYWLKYIEEELSCSYIKLHDNITETLRKLGPYYDVVKKEFSKRLVEANYCLRPPYKLSKIHKENIWIHAGMELLSSRNCYLLVTEYDIELTDLGEDFTLPSQLDNIQTEFEQKLEENDEESKDTREKKEEEISNLEEIELNNQKANNLFYGKSSSSFDSTKFMSQEEFYRKLVSKYLETNKSYSRTISNDVDSKKTFNCMRRYLVVNSNIKFTLDSEKDVKIKIKMKSEHNDIHPNNYLPASEIVVTVKKYSIGNAYTMLKYNPCLPFSEVLVQAEISSYDFGKDDYETLIRNLNVEEKGLQIGPEIQNIPNKQQSDDVITIKEGDIVKNEDIQRGTSNQGMNNDCLVVGKHTLK